MPYRKPHPWVRNSGWKQPRPEKKEDRPWSTSQFHDQDKMAPGDWDTE